MKTLLSVLQLIFAICLISTILLQAQGTGLGSIFGGAGETYRTRRGFEKIIFWATIAFSVGFLLTSIFSLFTQ